MRVVSPGHGGLFKWGFACSKIHVWIKLNSKPTHFNGVINQARRLPCLVIDQGFIPGC